MNFKDEKNKTLQLLKSLLFDGLFYITSVVIMIIFLPFMMLPQKFIFWVGRIWVRVTLYLLQKIVGLSYQVEGAKNLASITIFGESALDKIFSPDTICPGGYIIACKHESAWETLIFHLLVNSPAIVLKSELMWIPLINLYFKRMGMLTIDRGKGSSSLKNLVSNAQRILKENRPLVIFPEGNRAVPGKAGNYKTGIAALYKMLNVPVIPVALNSGSFWGRRSFIKYPGKITIKFLSPIQPGLPKAEFMHKLAHSIDLACEGLNENNAVNDTL